MAPQLDVDVYGPRGEQKVIGLCETKEQMQTMPVETLKRKISQELNIKSNLRMVFKSETMDESKMLSSYNIKHMSKIHTLLVLPGGQR